MDLISIIIPVYKVEEYLGRCMDSVLAQSYSALEIILVDDGSPDRCPQLCDDWATKDSRIKVVHKKNGGLSDARNAGMDVAMGRYIAFLDSDDWIHKDYIQRLYDAMVSEQADIAACNIVPVFSEEEAAGIPIDTTELRVCSAEEAIGDILSGKGFRAVAWNKLYKREMLENERYPVGKHHEDEFFTYRILGKAEKLVYVDTPLYYYFQRPGSLMQNCTIKRLDALDAYLERLEYLKARFPRLYITDKLVFCMSCIGFYRQFRNSPDQACKDKIRRCRRQVRFSLKELRHYRPKQLVYIFCSRYAIGIVSKS